MEEEERVSISHSSTSLEVALANEFVVMPLVGVL